MIRRGAGCPCSCIQTASTGRTPSGPRTSTRISNFWPNELGFPGRTSVLTAASRSCSLEHLIVQPCDPEESFKQPGVMSADRMLGIQHVVEQFGILDDDVFTGNAPPQQQLVVRGASPAGVAFYAAPIAVPIEMVKEGWRERPRLGAAHASRAPEEVPDCGGFAPSSAIARNAGKTSSRSSRAGGHSGAGGLTPGRPRFKMAES